MVVSANSAGHVQPERGDAFGQFVFSGDVPIGRIANFYGLPVARKEMAKSLTDFIRDHLKGRPRVGAEVRIEEVELVVQDARGSPAWVSSSTRRLSDPVQPGPAVDTRK